MRAVTRGGSNVAELRRARGGLTVNVPGSCSPPAAGLVGGGRARGNANDIVSTATARSKAALRAVVTGEWVWLQFRWKTAFCADPRMRQPLASRQSYHRGLGAVYFRSTPRAWAVPAAGDQYIVFKQNSGAAVSSFGLEQRTRVSGKDVSGSGHLATGQSAEIRSTTALTTESGTTWRQRGAPSVIQIYVNGNLEQQANVAFCAGLRTCRCISAPRAIVLGPQVQRKPWTRFPL